MSKEKAAMAVTAMIPTRFRIDIRRHSGEAATETGAEGTETGTETDAKPDLGDAGTRALKAEREARKTAEKTAKELSDRLKAIEDRDKSEVQKAADRAEAAEKRAVELESASTRLKVAVRHGLNESQAARLLGSTEDELDADAKDLAKQFNVKNRPTGDADQGFRGSSTSKSTPGDDFGDFLQKSLGLTGA